MSLIHNQFISKLNEMESEYRQMIQRIQLCHKGTHDEIAMEENILLNQCKEQEVRLKEMIATGRSQAITELASMQLNYFSEARAALEEKIPQYLKTVSKAKDNSHAEAMALYAEFAIDNAIQGIRYALLATFSAVDLQMKEDESAENREEVSKYER